MTTANSADETAATLPADLASLNTSFVMQLKVDIGARVEVGKSDAGLRRYIPITGGSFVGKDIQGEVLPGGADWQLTRPDGVLEVDALYSIKTNDGAVIIVHNQGIVAMGEQGAYVRTVPKFHAPEGPYDWLNKRIFVGTITPARDGSHVVIRVFKVE